MTTLVRVLLENGSKATMSKVVAEAAGDAIKILDEPALNPRTGKPLPVEFPGSEDAEPAGQSETPKVIEPAGRQVGGAQDPRGQAPGEDGGRRATDQNTTTSGD